MENIAFGDDPDASLTVELRIHAFGKLAYMISVLFIQRIQYEILEVDRGNTMHSGSRN